MCADCFSFCGTLSPDPLSEHLPWTPLGISVPQNVWATAHRVWGTISRRAWVLVVLLYPDTRYFCLSPPSNYFHLPSRTLTFHCYLTLVSRHGVGYNFSSRAGASQLTLDPISTQAPSDTVRLPPAHSILPPSIAKPFRLEVYMSIAHLLCLPYLLGHR